MVGVWFVYVLFLIVQLYEFKEVARVGPNSFGPKQSATRKLAAHGLGPVLAIAVVTSLLHSKWVSAGALRVIAIKLAQDAGLILHSSRRVQSLNR